MSYWDQDGDEGETRLVKKSLRNSLALGEIEQDLLEDSGRIVREHLLFRQIRPGEEEIIPEEWIEEVGLAEAQRRLRIAACGWLPTGDVPSGILSAQKIFVGIIKARATRGAAPTLNVQMVQMTAPMPEFPRKLVGKK